MTLEYPEGLQAHAGVVIGALPEAGLGVGFVKGAVREDCPPPFSAFTVHKILKDVIPGLQGSVLAGSNAMVLPQPEVTHHCLGLNPPLAGVVKGAVGEPLITHGSILEKAFVAGNSKT